MVIPSLAFNLAQVLRRVLALPGGVAASGYSHCKGCPPHTCAKRVVLSAPL